MQVNTCMSSGDFYCLRRRAPGWPASSHRCFLRGALILILFVADFLHPLDYLAVFLFLNGDVRHGRARCGPMPVLFAWREPNHITRADFLDRPAPTLRPAAPGRYDESLTERMRVPCRPRAGLERHTGALHKRRIRRLKKRI